MPGALHAVLGHPMAQCSQSAWEMGKAAVPGGVWEMHGDDAGELSSGISCTELEMMCVGPSNDNSSP